MTVKKVVAPVAGMGTRFLPATKAVPKEMLCLIDKPLIQYMVEEAVQAGLEELILVTAKNKNSIEDHFDRSVELELLLESKNDSEKLALARSLSGMIKISSVRQYEPKGLGHAVLQAKSLVGNEPFAVMLPDDIMYSEGASAIGQLVQTHEKLNAPVIAVQQVPEEAVSSYGVIEPEPAGDKLYKIKSLIEKPPREQAPSNLAVLGRYVLPPEVFALLEKTEPDAKGEIQLTNALNALVATTDIYGRQVDAIRYDAGDKMGFLQATVELALKRDDLGAEFREYLKGLDI